VIAPLLLAAALSAEPAAVTAKEAPLKEAPAKATKAAPAKPGVPGLHTDKPVRVDAQEVRFSWRTRQVTVVGNPFVTMALDEATLTCRKLTGENDAAGKLRVAVCTGEVRLVRGDKLVTCERATYDREAGTVVCTGNPVLRDQTGGTEARGTSLTYDVGAAEVRLEGAAQVTVPGGQLDLDPAGAGGHKPAPRAVEPPPAEGKP
jgi:lipopolysaccharide export system protein LptA